MNLFTPMAELWNYDSRNLCSKKGSFFEHLYDMTALIIIKCQNQCCLEKLRKYFQAYRLLLCFGTSVVWIKNDHNSYLSSHWCCNEDTNLSNKSPCIIFLFVKTVLNTNGSDSKIDQSWYCPNRVCVTLLRIRVYSFYSNII